MSLSLLAAAYDYNYTDPTTTSGGSGLGVAPVLVWLLVAVAAVAGIWKVFEKAGRPGWAALIPIYNSWVLFEISGKPGWWVLLGLIPFAGPVIVVVLSVMAFIELSKRFGKSGGFAALLLFLPFVGFPLLGFGDAKYDGSYTPDEKPKSDKPKRRSSGGDFSGPSSFGNDF